MVPQLTRIGDLVCATPVFRAIKERFPESYLAVLVSGKSWQILKNNPRIDQIIFYEDKKLISKLRQINFDYSIALTNNPIPSVLSVIAMISNRIKTVIADHSWSEWLTDWLNTNTFLYYHHTYLPRHYLKLLEPLGIKDAEVIAEIFISSQGEEKAIAFFENRMLKQSDILIGLAITAGNRIKEWGDEKFRELAKLLLSRHPNAKIIVLGSKTDEARVEALIGQVKSERIIKATHFSLVELPSLLKRLSIFVSVDTGPLYVAHALGIPVVDIIGPVDPNEQPPQDEKSIQVMPPSSIKPTSFVMKRAGRPEEHQHALDSISVIQVLEAVGKFLPVENKNN